MNIEIIPATLCDADALVAIQQKAFKRLYDIYRDEGSPYLRGADEIARWLGRPNWRVYKITADGVLCGGVSFCERNGMPGVYYLARIYVLPELQGRGIASTAILLCEQTVANANLWTLDFPADQPANRRCYEKADYIDTGERREQSGGAVTLAYMEKKLPNFRDIKHHIDNPVVREILAASAFDPSPENMNKKAAEFRLHNDWQLCGWVENGEILGGCGFKIHGDYVEILNIAVAECVRHHGIGTSMIMALQKQYKMAIEAETDDDAVDFYRKRGFAVVSFQKFNVRRWTCILPAPEASK